MNEGTSPLMAKILPSLLNGKVPLHVHVEPRSLSKSSDLPIEKLSLETYHCPNTKVVVRIRPLCSAEIDAGEKCCLRPVLANANSWDPNHSKSPSLEKKRILSPSTSKLNCLTTRSKILQVNNKASSEGLKYVEDTPVPSSISTSLIASTEKEEKFDFDQVIGPHTTQEQCYESLVQDLLYSNVKLGKATTIVVMGPAKSGKTYTLNGDWKFNSNFESNNLVEHAGILPRAVYDLFEATKVLQLNESKSAVVFMAFYMVAYDGGYTRDLLSRVDGKVKEVIKGVSYVHVDSPQDVKQIMDNASKKLASEKQKGKKFHTFACFRVCRPTKSASTWQISSKLTLVNLTTSIDMQVEQQERYNEPNLRDVLQSLSIPPERQGPDSERRFASLRRRLDDALLGATSTLLIACVSPVESEMETCTHILRLCSLARGATYFREGPGSSWRSISTTSVGDQSTLSSEAGESSGTLFSRWQQQTMHLAGDTLMNGSKGSASLDQVGTKWKSERSKLSRASTVAALSLMATMTATKGEQKTSGEVVQAAVPRGPRRREKVDSAMSPRTVKNIRYSRRNGPKLLRENKVLKSEIRRLRKESQRKGERIRSLEDELALVNSELVEERQITSKLEDIRDLLKRKALLQEQRIRVLEQKKINPPRNSPDAQSTIIDLQNICSPIKEGATITNETILSQDGLANFSGIGGKDFNNVNLLASFEESFEGDAIYLSGDETGSADSRPSFSYLQTISLASGFGHHVDTDTSNLVSLDDVTKCGCQRTLLTSEYNDKIEFYLPKLRVSCLCGRQQLKISTFSEDLVRIETIFRPWQSEFLTSIGIVEVDQFIEMHHKEEKKLVRKLRKWRIRKEVEAMSKSSCAVALRVWARACLVVIRCRGGSVPKYSSGDEDAHDFLDISSMGSSIGF